MGDIPPCPPALKAIQHYLKIAQEHENRDPVVRYWCQLYALQSALNIDRKSDDSKVFLMQMMDQLERLKTGMKDNEAITNEVAAQAHIENYALKLFEYADSQDRAASFGKNVVKAFYTAGMLFDVLTTFGELPEELQQNQKYAKWKAAYIHNCLKNGETPVPGPIEENEGAGENEGTSSLPPKQSSVDSDDANTAYGLPQVPDVLPPSAGSGLTPPGTSSFPQIPPTGFDLPPAPYSQPTGDFSFPSAPQSAFSLPSPAANLSPADNTALSSGPSLTPAQTAKAQKYCKWAGSALNYDDIPTALMNLEKAVRLLKTGVDT